MYMSQNYNYKQTWQFCRPNKQTERKLNRHVCHTIWNKRILENVRFTSNQTTLSILHCALDQEAEALYAQSRILLIWKWDLSVVWSVSRKPYNTCIPNTFTYTLTKGKLALVFSIKYNTVIQIIYLTMLMNRFRSHCPVS